MPRAALHWGCYKLREREREMQSHKNRQEKEMKSYNLFLTHMHFYFHSHISTHRDQQNTKSQRKMDRCCFKSTNLAQQLVRIPGQSVHLL